jgi:Uma2 family endonuclease
MEAKKLQSFNDLLTAWQTEERLELINGDILRRPMARYEHGSVQGDIIAGLSPYKKDKGPGGWWIATEISVRYSDHQCPSHDLAGWRKERVSGRPTGVMETAPDWVCEITSPGHEKKDYLDVFLLLQKYQVPYYWVISPEDQTLLAYKLIKGKYSVIETIDHRSGRMRDGRVTDGRARIEPFIEVEFDLNDVFGTLD